MKTITLKCKLCGDVEINSPFFENGEEGFIMPTAICPTLDDVEREYEALVGESYESLTGGIKMKEGENFIKEVSTTLNHENPDSIIEGTCDCKKNWRNHTLEPTEVWREIHWMV